MDQTRMLAQNLHPAIFLDKDGTLLENVPYGVDPYKMCFTSGTEESLRLLNRAGYRLVVISNQSGVARGLFPEAALEAVCRQMEAMLSKEGLRLDGFYYCPHHPHGRVDRYSIECYCRKPNPGLVFQAAREHELDLARSWFIGDTLDDMECGRRANCGTVLIDNGDETEWVRGPFRQPDFAAPDLLQAAQIILEHSREPFRSTKRTAPFIQTR